MDLQQQLWAAFEARGLAAALGDLKPSQRPDLCDFVCNGALAAAAKLKGNPVTIANDIVSELEPSTGTVVQVVGRGFINVTTSTAWILEQVAQQFQPEPNNKTVFMDFGGPNIAKPMHVGHLRSLVIGDSLSKMAEYLGYTVVKDIHLGDWGVQMGMLLHAYDENVTTAAGLVAQYKMVSTKCKESPYDYEMSQKWTRLLQDNEPQATFMWKHIKQISLTSVKADLANLGISFNLWLGESDAGNYIKAILSKLDNVRESDGALIAGSYDPPLMLKNSAGVWLYAATDLATIYLRNAKQADEIVYVVDERQALHFKQVFEAAKNITNTALVHVGFGTINGPDGKPFKTREGDTPLLSDLLNEAQSKALVRAKDEHVAARIALAALKFNDLKNKRTTSYAFDLDQALSHEGHTGVYLLYAVTRINSIEAKALEGNIKPTTPVLDTSIKRQIGLTLANFNKVVQNAWQNKMPHFMCEHLLTLASQFTSLYSQENIANDPSNLELALHVRDQLTLGLTLLGIQTVPKM